MLLHSKLCITDQCILIVSLESRKETRFPIPISKIEKLRPDELVCPRGTYYQILHCKIFLLSSFKATGERGEWENLQATRYHLRGFCIHMKLYKMRGSNERHFLLGTPTSFEKNYTSREADTVRRALIMLSSETILRRRRGPGSSL